MAVQMSLADDRAICEAATPGPWAADKTEVILVDPTGEWIATLGGIYGGETEGAYEDAAFIAHFNPAYVSKLLDVVEAAGEAERYVFSHPARTDLADALAALEAVDDA